MRTIQVKIWPEIKQQYPAIIPNERLSKSKENIFVLDLSNTIKVESSALTMLLLNLIKLVGGLDDKRWDITYPKNEELSLLIRNLNFYKLLIKSVPNANLFWQSETLHQISNVPIVVNERNKTITTFPIYELDFLNAINPRDEVDHFKDYLILKLYYLQDKYEFEVNVFIQILIEMAKNSADHTKDNAYFGLDIVESEQTVQIQFSFGDLGIGINQSIRDYIKEDKAFKNKEQHLAITDAYHYALQIGNTTKVNSLNKGIGMASIFSLSKQMNMDLSVYDANSRGVLSFATNTTHTELRKVFYSIGFKVGFYYYGETEISKA